jgi:hypothetical protein
MASYLCNRLSYPEHVHGSVTFEALDDDKASEIAATFCASGAWLNYEVWQGARLVRYVRRIGRMEATGVLAELAAGR